MLGDTAVAVPVLFGAVFCSSLTIWTLPAVQASTFLWYDAWMCDVHSPMDV
jgi:hypothetical protein